MTSQIICDVTTALKHGKYIEKLKLAAQAVYVQMRDGTKPGLWTLDWTMDWIMDSILDSIGQ